MKKALSRSIFNKFALLLVGISTLSLTSCLDDEDPVAPQPVSYVSFYHGSPAAPNLNILINDEKINQGAIEYSYYSNFLSFNPRSVRVKFSPVNAENPSVDTTLTLVKNHFYSFFVVDKATDIDLVVLANDTLLAPAVGKAKIRFINLSTDAPEVNVSTTGAAAATLFTGVGFKESTDFIEVASGTHPLQVTATNGGTVLLPVPNVSLTDGSVYTMVFRGLATKPAGDAKALNFQLLKVGN
jgi:hypothetical protein